MIRTKDVLKIEKAFQKMEDYFLSNYIKSKRYRVIVESSFIWILKKYCPYSLTDIGNMFNMTRQHIYIRLNKYERIRKKYPDHTRFLEEINYELLKELFNVSNYQERGDPDKQY